MAAATRPESVGTVLELRLPVWFKSVLDHSLKGAVDDSRDAERALPAVGLGDVDPLCRERLPRLVFSESIYQPPRASGVLTTTLSTPGVFFPLLVCVTRRTAMTRFS